MSSDRTDPDEPFPRHPLRTPPPPKYTGSIPNTTLSVALLAFLLGGTFSLGILTFAVGGFAPWWATYQLGFFAAAWSLFHWGEFAVTAGWNFEKCSVDCALLAL
jgi:protein-S-isoprenylcysteine O-methyltransferase